LGKRAGSLDGSPPIASPNRRTSSGTNSRLNPSAGGSAERHRAVRQAVAAAERLGDRVRERESGECEGVTGMRGAA